MDMLWQLLDPSGPRNAQSLTLSKYPFVFFISAMPWHWSFNLWTVRLLCGILMELEFYSQIFEKSQAPKVMKIIQLEQICSLSRDWPTDRHAKANSCL